MKIEAWKTLTIGVLIVLLLGAVLLEGRTRALLEADAYGTMRVLSDFHARAESIDHDQYLNELSKLRDRYPANKYVQFYLDESGVRPKATSQR